MSRVRTHPISRTRPVVADDYLDLVKQFPLRPIRTKHEKRIAGEILDRFVGREDLTPGQRDYLAALVRFVEDYEQEQLRDWVKAQSPIEMLRHLMEENGMTTTELGHILGSRGLASEVLNGKRQLSKTLIHRLASRFAVDPGVFLSTGRVQGRETSRQDKPMSVNHPVVFYMLNESDPGFKEGGRYRIDDRDGDQHVFKNRNDAVRFAKMHGLRQINEKDMIAIREGPKTTPLIGQQPAKCKRREGRKGS